MKSLAFRPRFRTAEINRLAADYDKRTQSLRDGSDWKRELEIVSEIAPRVKRDHVLSREDFLRVCCWKSPRPMPHYQNNTAESVVEITRIALAPSTSEELRIGVLTLLQGVKWPMASVFLHFFSNDKYPILDFRALWSLGIAPKGGPGGLYKFPFWQAYTEFCRGLADKTGVSMRTLDKALWQYSYLNQP